MLGHGDDARNVLLRVSATPGTVRQVDGDDEGVGVGHLAPQPKGAPYGSPDLQYDLGLGSLLQKLYELTQLSGFLNRALPDRKIPQSCLLRAHRPRNLGNTLEARALSECTQPEIPMVVVLKAPRLLPHIPTDECRYGDVVEAHERLRVEQPVVDRPILDPAPGVNDVRVIGVLETCLEVVRVKPVGVIERQNPLRV